MSKADKKIKRNKENFDREAKYEDYSELSKDIELAKGTLLDNINAHNDVLDNILKELDVEDSPVRNMIKRKKEILEGMLTATQDIDSSISNSMKSINEADEVDTIDIMVSIGENIGNYNMLHVEANNVMEEVYKIAGGE